MALPPLDPDLRKKLLLGVALFGMVGYLGYDRVYKPRAAQVAELETRLAAVQTQNTTARGLIKGGGTGTVEQELSVHREQLRIVEGLIPSSEELPDLLDAISVEARRSGVEISLIQPVGATAEQYYTRRVYDMAVIGSYHQIGAFLTRVASLPRIVTPMNLVLAPKPPAEGDSRSGPDRGEAERLEGRFSIETYVIPAGGESNAAD